MILRIISQVHVHVDLKITPFLTDLAEIKFSFKPLSLVTYPFVVITQRADEAHCNHHSAFVCFLSSLYDVCNFVESRFVFLRDLE